MGWSILNLYLHYALPSRVMQVSQQGVGYRHSHAASPVLHTAWWIWGTGIVLCNGLAWSCIFFYQWDKTYSDLLLKVMCCQASTKPPLIQKVHFSTSINNNRYRTGFLKALKQMGKPQNDPARAVTGQRWMTLKIQHHIGFRTSGLFMFDSTENKKNIAVWGYNYICHHFLLSSCHSKEV